MAFLKNPGVLGINARNLLFVRPYNKGKALKLADSKLITKSFLSARGIPVPRLYATIRSRGDLEKFDFSSLPNSFVLKPNQGSGGEGILLIWDQRDGQYILSDGRLLSQEALEEHIADTLDGRFSISGVADAAFFEQLLICDDRLAQFTYKGLPDIRVVVYNLVPVMAMLRLPTKKSKGKANLHQGAIGVGIDIAKGQATHVVQGSQIIDEIPDAGSIRGLKIPFWDTILMIASKVQLETNLGYLAADIAIDNTSGPVLLEINARAGLAVQIANLAPLRKRLERIQGIKVTTPEKGVRLAKDLFGNVFEKEIKHISGKEVVGIVEPIKVVVGSKPYRAMARLNPDVEKTQFDAQFAKRIGLFDSFEKSPSSFKLKFILAGRRVQTVASLMPLETTNHQIVIGRRDLNDFLIDPTKSDVESKGIEALPSIEKKNVSSDSIPARHFREVDSLLAEIDEKIKLLYHLRPINLIMERRRFFSDQIDNPHFVYPSLQFEPYELKDRLNGLHLDDSVLGRLFQRKRLEILRKIDLLEHRGTAFFYDKSVELFGVVTHAVLNAAEQRLKEKPPHFLEDPPVITSEMALKRFQRFFYHHGLKHWKAQFKKNIVSDCVAGKRGAFFIRKDVKFSETRFKMVLAHEVQTHIFTAENGSHQPYKIFQRGTGGYLATQEGLAIYNQEKVVSHLTPKHFWNPSLVVLIHVAQKSSFRDVYEKAISMGFSQEKAFQFALKVKRGFEDTSASGAFTKDLVYFVGRQMIEDFVKKGGDLKRLYIGKIDLASLEEIESLTTLVTPKYVPDFLSMDNLDS